MKEFNQKHLRDSLKKARLEKGFSQEELAGLLHTHQVCISQLENGRRPLSYAMLDRLADILGESFRPKLDLNL